MQSLARFSIILFCLSVLFACTPESKEEEKTEPMKPETQISEVLVGTYTDAESKGIYLFDFNAETGKLENQRLVAESTSPSYLTISKDRQFVYAVNETAPGNVSAFKWNDDRSQLIALNQEGSQGDHPCHVELNGQGNLVAVSNYSSGNIAAYKIDAEGIIQANPAVHQHAGRGPVEPNQTSPHAHCAKFDANGKFLYAVDLGTDQVVTYPVNADGNVGAASSQLLFEPGDGPRQLIFHPTKNIAFVINELSNSVVSIKVNHETGVLETISNASTLPEGYGETSYCADIHISADGKFLYASNRGHNSIAIFSVAETGELTMLGTESVQGDWPRYFTLSPNGKHLLVANQNSNNITIFDVDSETGLLTFTGNEVSISKPVVMKF